MGRGSSWRSLPLPWAVLALVLVLALTGLASAAATSPQRTIRPATLPSGVVGVTYAERLPAVGRARPTTLRVTRGHVPSGLVLTGAGLLRGRPSARGIWRFTVAAFAPGGSTAGARGYRLTIAAAPPKALRPARPVIGPQSLPAAQLDEQYTGQLTVRGPSPPYALRVTNGALPIGLAVSTTGRLSGMPSEPGKHTFTVSAFKRGKYVAFRDYTLAVEGEVPAPYFTDDFENGLGQWNKEGAPSAFGLAGGSSGQGASITAGPSTTGPSSGVSELASLWLDWPAAHASSGKSTWYAARVMFPAAYDATTGQWNWFIEWHVDDATSGYVATSPSLGVYTDYPVGPNRGRNPRLAFRLNGGPVSDPRTHVFTMPSNSLVRGRWYDLVVHFVWSPSAEVGRAELWIDGRRRVSTSFPTLYTLPNGSASFGYFGLYNYRLKASWDSSIHFDRVRIGPTLSSVR